MSSGIINSPYPITKRTMGDYGSREALGAGYMNKSGFMEDTYDRTFETYAMVYVIQGRGEYRDEEGNIYELSPGTVFQRFSGVFHVTLIDPESRWEELFIDMGPQLFRGLRSSRFIREDLPVIPLKPDPLLAARIGDYIDTLRRCPEENLGQMIPEMLGLISHIYSLGAGRQEQKDESDMVNTARNYFLKHCTERINLEIYCRDNGWGYERFRKVFRAHTALSPGQFIIQKRIDRASELLLGTSCSIKEIGSRLGYPSPYEFSHQFKKIAGRSPREYRNQQGR